VEAAPTLRTGHRQGKGGVLIELRQLRWFVRVAEELNFSRAAEQEHVSQPALSQQIRRLERELGVQLFERSTHHVRLTDPGRLLVDHARRVLGEVEAVRVTAERAATGRLGTLRLGCVGYAKYWPAVQAALDRLGQSAPDVVVEGRYDFNDAVRAALVAGEVDAAFLAGPLAGDGLDDLSVVREPVLVALPRTHALATLTEVALARLAGETLLLWPRSLDPGAYDALVSFFATERIPLAVAEVPPVFQEWLGAVAAGKGFALLSPANELRHAGVVQLPVVGPVPMTELRLAWRRDHRTPLVEGLIRACTAAAPATERAL
jgi:DNA-binding transcriptional LysR family regulator